MLHEKIRLWEPGEYRGAGSDGFEPWMDAYVLAGSKIRPGVVVFPGGGYGFRSARESEAVALRFNAAGCHAFVLNYSVAPRRHPLPFLDAAKAFSLLRSRTGEYSLRPGALGALGFSAGGHLAAHLATRAEAGSRPDFLILSYPVISSGKFSHRGSFDNLLGPGAGEAERACLSLESGVGADTPPTFIWHTWADQAVPLENSLFFVQALRSAGVPFEFHVFPHGAHGLALSDRETEDEAHPADPQAAVWMDLCLSWLERLTGES